VKAVYYIRNRTPIEPGGVTSEVQHYNSIKVYTDFKML
jgi:hypothetical protein